MKSTRLPILFLVGAPKCGTTSLATWLSAHASIYMSQPKEPHFFSTDIATRQVTTWEAYRGLFASAQPQHLVLGEASTWYLWSREAVPGIERDCPGSRFVVLVRDPVEMVRSLHLHNLRHLHEDVGSLDRAWRLQEARAAGRPLPPTCGEAAFLQYRAAALHGLHLSRLLEKVEGSRVLVLDLEDLRRQPREAFSSVLEFLGLRDDPAIPLEVHNEARLPRSRTVQRFLRFAGGVGRKLGLKGGSGILRWNEKGVTKPLLSPELEVEMRAAFAEDQQLLQRLLPTVRRVASAAPAAGGGK